MEYFSPPLGGKIGFLVETEKNVASTMKVDKQNAF